MTDKEKARLLVAQVEKFKGTLDYVIIFLRIRGGDDNRLLEVIKLRRFLDSLIPPE